MVPEKRKKFIDTPTVWLYDKNAEEQAKDSTDRSTRNKGILIMQKMKWGSGIE